MIAWENKSLVCGALKCAHIRPDHPQYDDYYQNGVIIYAQMLEQHSDKSRKEVDKLSFRKIIWATTDQIRHENHFDECEFETSEAVNMSEDYLYDDLLLLKDELLAMREIERAILIENIVFKRKISDMEEYGLHRGSLQRIKQKLLTRLREKYNR